MFTQTLFAQGTAGQANPLVSIGMMAVIFVIFYFLLIRPQRQQQKKLAQSISQLHKGDKVLVAGGIVAEYVSEKDGGRIAIVKIGDDTKIEIVKSAISSVLTDAMLNPPVREEPKKKEPKNKIKEDLEKANSKAKKDNEESK